MRYEKGHKEETRQRIVLTASEAFREKGIDGVSVADVMARVGLTHGGFYSHFASKDALVEEVLDTCFREGRLRRQRDEGKNLEELIRSYLRAEHRDNAARGCPAASFVGEMSRRPDSARKAFGRRLERMTELVAGALPSGTPAARKKRAAGIVATLIGALQMARVAPDSASADAALDSGIDAAMALARRR